MSRQVPLARRNLQAEPRRLLSSVCGVGLALMLILLLDGLWAGVDAKTTVYEDSSGADLFIAEAGTRTFFSTNSVIPATTLEQVAADPDVQWAAKVRGMFTIMSLHDTKVAAYLVGSQPGAPGGVWRLLEGAAPQADDEVAVGRILADRHGIDVGDTLDVLGQPFTVVGVADADMFMFSFVFLTHDATDELLRAPGTTSFVIAATDHPDAVRRRLADLEVEVLTRDELKRNDLAAMARPFMVPLRVMTAVAFAIGSLVIALTVYSAIIEHRRDYGIVKALGADRRRLVRVALTQSLTIAGLGLVTGGLLFLGGRELIGWYRPQFAIVLSPGIVARAAGAATVMGLLAAVLPARRLARLDPATAYRGG